MSGTILIVGAGQAAVQAAESLRAGGYAGDITLLGDEAHGPYHRPPLSKAWLAGEMDGAQLVMRAPEMLARKNITLRTGVRVEAIDRAAKVVRLADGSALPYDGLVLATGSTPRSLPLPGGAAAGVHALRSRGDADAISARLALCQEQQRPVVVIGGGFIGLEVAATARKKGLTVTVLEAAPRLLGRVLAPALSDWYAALHRSHGVELVFDARIEALETGADGSVSGVRLADGSLLPHQRPGHRRSGRLHRAPAARWQPGPARVGAERDRAGEVGRRRAAGTGSSVHGHALVLERPVRQEAADGGPLWRCRAMGRARRHGWRLIQRLPFPRG